MSNETATSVMDVYQRHGAAWAMLRSDQSFVEASWLDRFCRQLPSNADILDIGCGSGFLIARELCSRGFAVTGVDGSPTMLAMFRSNLPTRPAYLCDMRQLDLGQRFAGLLAWDSFFHLSPEDQRTMFPRFAAHAAPGAMLMFTSGVTEGDAIGEFQGMPLYHGSLGSSEYRDLLTAYKFEVVDHVVEDPNCGHRTVWLAQNQNC